MVARMRTPHCAFIALVIVVAALSFAVSAEDVPETDYDESESLPYQSEVVFSLAVPQSVAKTSARRAPRDLQLQVASSRTRCSHPFDQRPGSAYPISYSLTVLDCILRC